MSDLSIDAGRVREILINFIRDQTAQAGYSRGLVNLSGGLDSALVCYLAAEALGPENVLALRLPYRTSSPESLEHAQMVIDAAGVQSLTLDISPMVDPLIAAFPDMSSVRKGNIMARERMIVLYDQTVAFHGLAIGTGNKTEALLGYTTIYGDSAAAFEPIGDLYKTQVRQLARATGAPAVIIAKPPSADLWLGQTDEGEFGFTYEEVDELLYLLVDRQYTPEQAVEAGFAEPFVREVTRRIRQSHFKRVMPPIANIH